MRTINALKIAIGNFALVFKNLLYKTIIAALLGTVLSIVLKVNLQPLVEAAAPVLRDVADIIKAIMTNEDYAALADSLLASWQTLTACLSSNIGNMVGVACLCVLFLYLYRFLGGAGDSVSLILVNGYMGSLSHREYVGTFLENLKKILVYQLIDAALLLVFVLVVIGVDAFIILLTIAEVPVLGIFLCALVSFFAAALFSTCMSQTSSNALVGGEGIKNAFKKGLFPKNKYFWKMFAAYLVADVAFVYFACSTAIFTFGVGSILVNAFFAILIASMRQVDYFTINKKKYFIDYDNIVVPKELRENDEKLLNKIDI